MPRYIIRRTFPHGLAIAQDADGARRCRAVIERNAEDGVTWLHSYVSADRSRTYCIYEGPSPEAIRRCAIGNQLPLDTMTEVSVLDPWFYRT